MNAESQMRTAPSINGHMIILGAGHSIAIYERNRECYVAEFRDGYGMLAYTGTWFRFHAGTLKCYNGRAALRSSMPLTPEMLEQIERLHRQSEARQERMLAVPGNVAAIAKRCLLGLMSWTRGVASKPGRTVG